MKSHFFLFSLLFISITGYSQNNQNQKLFNDLKTLDSLLFDRGFNHCETQYFDELISDNFEFYHDKSGVINSKADFLKGMKNGICNPSNSTKSRRELIPESLKVFPLYHNNELYGALQNGSHKFFETQNGIQQAASIAEFSHLWILEDNSWKIQRVLSYDHKAIPLVTDTNKIELNENMLKQYVGTYNAEKTGIVNLSIKNGNLWLSAGKMETNIYPKKVDIFYHDQAPLVFKFLKNNDNEVYKMVVIENGNTVETAIKQ